MKYLKPGDQCPCCGNPIKTSDPAKLYILSFLADAMEHRGIAAPLTDIEEESEHDRSKDRA